MARPPDDLAAPWSPGGMPPEEADLHATLEQLRDENIRLRAELARSAEPSMPGPPQHAGTELDADELLDEAWSILAEVLAIREGLDQASEEIEMTIEVLRARLARFDINGQPASRPGDLHSAAGVSALP
jgi:hypothetical protein